VSNTFQVDLRGIVDLLSHHLYASPRVYVRELLQNAVDAITAADHAGTGKVAITTGAGTLEVADNGIGLTEAQVHELLATIGRSSKTCAAPHAKCRAAARGRRGRQRRTGRDAAR
jgi:molecular chaperone HtpG